MTIDNQSVFQNYNSVLFKRLCLLILLCSLADWLFFNRSIHITLPLFLIALAMGAFIVRRYSELGVTNKFIYSLPFFAVMPGIETFNVLTAGIGVFGVMIFALLINDNIKRSFLSWVFIFFRFVFFAPTRLLSDVVIFKRVIRRSCYKDKAPKRIITVSFVPILFTFGFLILFALANPLIGRWIENVDYLTPFKSLNFYRILFWIVMASASWTVLHVSKGVFGKRENIEGVKRQDDQRLEASSPFLTKFLGRASILQSLIMFNMLFAVQSYLDVVYLWGRHELPEGISYAAYAHQGTYILIITALLAGAFILFAMSKSLEGRVSSLIKALLLLWTMQNIVLVISTMMRMGLYIEVYALTYLRVAALIWMGLVMIGLVLILVRILLKYPNMWLIKANFISLTMVFYIVSFINLPHVISSYNVSVAIQNTKNELDINYLISLGENSLPAITIAMQHPRWEKRDHLQDYGTYTTSGNNLRYRAGRNSGRMLDYKARIFELRLKRSLNNWHQWSFRRYRLKLYLAKSEREDLQRLKDLE